MFFHSPPFIEVGASGIWRTSATFLTAKSSDTKLTPPSPFWRSSPRASMDTSVCDRAPMSPVLLAVALTLSTESGEGAVTWTRE